MSDIVVTNIFIIIGVVAGGIIGFVSMLLSNKYFLRKQAASDLRCAFTKILSGIRTGKLSDESDIRNFAITSFDTHTFELERFRFYIRDFDKEEYDKACEEYHNIIYMRPINHGSNLPADKFYIEKVGAILRFAKP